MSEGQARQRTVPAKKDTIDKSTQNKIINKKKKKKLSEDEDKKKGK